MKNNDRFLVILVLVLDSVSVNANAALVDRGGGLIYDTDLNITWLADANYAKTSGYDADGKMDWNTAMIWADQLEFGSFNDWRLPTTMQPDLTCSTVFVASNGQTMGAGYNCTGSEMGHLFYAELGGIARNSIQTSTDSDLMIFRNIQEADYWSSTPYVTEFSGPWAFGFFSGVQSTDAADFEVYAWAVRNGDVAAVPIPAAFWLFGSGVVGMLGFMRHRKS